MLFYFYKNEFMLKQLKQWLGLSKPLKTSAEDVMKKFLLVGLGNIGHEYADTRHNVGFNILDHFIKDYETTFETLKLGDIAKVKLKGRTLILLKPNTYMNLSGKAVKYWMDKEKIPMDHLLVLTDDLNLPFGTIRLKTKGSDGGHNGLKDIQDKLQTTNYNRFRFGISDNYSKGRQVDYVLGKWSDEELSKLEERLQVASEAIKSFVLSGMKETMNQFNGK
jgi:PTH1 family peptidyl-tRNA hydrolase